LKELELFVEGKRSHFQASWLRLPGAAWRQHCPGGKYRALESDWLVQTLPLLLCAFGKNYLNCLSFDVSSLP
jgi:hypothetical protein